MCGASICDKVHPLMIYGIWSICHIRASLIITWTPVISINTRISLSHFTSFFLYYHIYPSATATPSLCRCRHPLRTAHLCRSSSPSSNPNRRGKHGPIVLAADSARLSPTIHSAAPHRLARHPFNRHHHRADHSPRLHPPSKIVGH